MTDEQPIDAKPPSFETKVSKEDKLEPYVGPRSFESKDADFFFGREHETSEILSLVIAHQIVLLYARSGAGKTSLINTKLKPILEDEGFEVLPAARVQWATPGGVDSDDIPNLYVFNTISSLVNQEIEPDKQKELSLVDYLRELERPLPNEDELPRPRLLIFDQFEELFTSYPHRWQDRETFFQQVREALQEDRLLRVLFAMREDHIAHLDPYTHLLPENLRTRYRIERLRRDMAVAAVINPLKALREKAESSGYTGPTPSYKPGVPEKLVKDLMTIQIETEAGKTEGKPGEFVEPVQLQIVCQSLWQHLPPEVEEITEEHLENFGNVDQALARFYEMCITVAVEGSGLAEENLREFFEKSLITPAGTRSIVYKDEKKGETGGISNMAVEILENLHLIRQEWRSGSPWYELVHDRFIQPIRVSNEAFKLAYFETQLPRLLSSVPISKPRPLPPDETKTRADLRTLLNNVKTSWIKGVLENPAQGVIQLNLDKAQQPEMVDNPFVKTLTLFDQTHLTLSADKKMSDIFDEVNRHLLILGGPGSGKTNALLELARDLIVWAERGLEKKSEDFSRPIPVIFSLSTWTNKQQPLLDWLVEELSSQYRTPQRISRRWFEARRLLPMLDDLDGVEPESQAACIEAINAFVEDSSSPGIVVCSRSKDYADLPVRFKFYGAISLRPLTPDQINQYLTSAGRKLDTLRSTWQSDDALQILTQSPLMLNMMRLAYQEQSVDELIDPTLNTLEKRRQHLFDAYIKQVLDEPTQDQAKQPYSPKKWLSWLAQKMSQDHQTIFLIEQLQPSWLSTRIWRWANEASSQLIGGLIFGLSSGLILGLIGGLFGGTDEGLIGGLLGGLFGLLSGLFGGLIVWLIFGLVFGLLDFRKKASSRWRLGITILLIIGLVGTYGFGLIIYLIWEKIPRLTSDTQTVEALRWSWRRALRGAKYWLIIGSGIGLIIGLISALAEGLPRVLWPAVLGGGGVGALIGALIGGVSYGLIRAIFVGLSSEIVEVKAIPNQGIRLLRSNALLAGQIAGLIYGLIGGLIGLIIGLANDGLTGTLIGTLIGALIGGGYFGVLAVLLYGGLDIIQNYTLRFILYVRGRAPRNYPSFLEYAAEHTMLCKVGSGYIFVNRLLQEYFAAMGEGREQHE